MSAPDRLQQSYGRALELHQQGLFQQAAGLYEEILRCFPDADLVRYNLGLALYEQQKFDQAASAFLHAVKINPDDPDYWFNAGLALKRAGRFDEAIAAYEQAARLQPDDADIFYNLGCCLQAAGNDRAAAVAYEKALDRAVDHVPALGNLACCLHRGGDYARAAELYRRLLDLQPDHVSARYMLDALEGKNTGAPPPAYVQGLFDGYSENFDRDLLENLSYRVPALLSALLRKNIGSGRHNLRVLDLGCGTGLAGQAIALWAACLIGVDLSENMVVQAEKKGCYHQLVVGDVVDFLKKMKEPIDLLLAADVLTYLGALEPLFQAAGTVSRPGCLFCFSTEHSEENDRQLRPTGRYGHHPDYIHRVAEAHGWQLLDRQQAEIRKERDAWIVGDLYLFAI
ncbi:MAG TPA: tetratricopeptide repeat protein [Desulfobulbus sp.]|nr:tetratricopeptide repeat protein [Desulfobulbus sp.]